MYFAGLDGGGTKTLLQIMDENKKVVYKGRFGGLNYNSLPEVTLKATIDAILEQMKLVAGSLEVYRGVCVASAGIRNPKAYEFLWNAFKEAGIGPKDGNIEEVLKVVGDHEAALKGALGDQIGIVIASGTGSICFGIDDVGNTYRTGGWGHLIDDKGSGYDLGAAVLTTAVEEYDDRLEGDDFLKAVLRHINGETIDDIIGFTYGEETTKDHIAALAPLLIEFCDKENTKALDICEKAGQSLAVLVEAVAKKLKVESCKLVYIGSVLEHYEVIRCSMEKVLMESRQTYQFVEPMGDSGDGAVLLAYEMYKGENNGRYVS